MAEYYIDEDGKQAVDPATIAVGDVLHSVDWKRTDYYGLGDVTIHEYALLRQTVSEAKRVSYSENSWGVNEHYSIVFDDGAFITLYKGEQYRDFNGTYYLTREEAQEEMNENCRLELEYGEESLLKALAAIEFLRSRVKNPSA